MAERSIDDLPEEVLAHILSFLTTLEAVRASLISKKWRNLWHQIPSLNFDMWETPFSWRKNSNFAHFLTETLILRPRTTPLHSFQLNFSGDHISQIQVDSWIRHAINFGSTILRLSFPLGEEMYYFNNFFDLKNRLCSVRVLHLCLCQIDWPTSVLANGFPSLSSVTLTEVYVNNDDVLSALISSFVNLEFLSLFQLCGVKNVKIHSKTLKELELTLDDRGMESLDICAPNLRKIDVNVDPIPKCCSRDLSCLVEADVCIYHEEEESKGVDCNYYDMMLLLSSAERLTLTLFEFPDPANCHKYPAFKNLKHLDLKSGAREVDLYEIVAFLEQCPQLESLVLHFDNWPCGFQEEGFNRKPPRFRIPNLKQVQINNFRGTKEELYFVELLKTHKVVLEKIVAFPEQRDQLKLSTSLVLYESSMRPNKAMAANRILSLVCITSMHDFVDLLANELKNAVVKDVYNVKIVERCRSYQSHVMQILATTLEGDEELLGKGLEIKGRLKSVLAEHDNIVSSTMMVIDTSSN